MNNFLIKVIINNALAKRKNIFLFEVLALFLCSATLTFASDYNTCSSTISSYKTLLNDRYGKMKCFKPFDTVSSHDINGNFERILYEISQMQSTGWITPDHMASAAANSMLVTQTNGKPTWVDVIPTSLFPSTLPPLDGRNLTNLTIYGDTITGLNASHIESGTLPNARFPASLPAVSGENLTNLSLSQLTTGTVPDARFPATLPAVSGANLTNLNASKIGSGTLDNARFPATLPAVSGVNLTALNANQLTSGTIPDARFPATLPAVSGANLTSLNASHIGGGTLDNTLFPAILPAVSGANLTHLQMSNLSSGTFSFDLSTSGYLQSKMGTAAGPHIDLVNTSKTTAGTAKTWSIYNREATGYLNSLQFVACDATPTCNTRMVIKDSGEVGIGNFSSTSPITKLQVDGQVYIGGPRGINANVNGLPFTINDGSSRALWIGPYDDAAVQGTGVIYGATDGTGNHYRLNIVTLDRADGTASTDDEIFIGNVQYSDGSKKGMLIKNGYVGILNTSPQYPLDVTGDISTSTCIRTSAGNSGGTCSSDERLKKDIRPFTLGLQALLGITPHYYKYNGLGGQPESKKEQVGVIAQEIEKAAPELVSSQRVKFKPTDTQETEIKTVNYTSLIYVAINAIKEFHHSWQRETIKTQRSLASLQEENRQLKKEEEIQAKELENLEKEAKQIELENLEIQRKLQVLEQKLKR